MPSHPEDGAPVGDEHEAGAAPFPPAWRVILLERVSFYRSFDEEERARFEARVALFVRTKTFGSLDKLEITDEMKVVVAAAACRLTMNILWADYAQVPHVALRASSFRDQTGAPAIGQGGRWSVTISWPDLVDGFAIPDDGCNVGYHEFAHVLDGADGSMDGEAQGPAAELYLTWSEVISSGRAQVQRALDANAAAPLDAYAAKNDAEFFAVSTEWFFERPCSLRERLPAVYELLSRFYRQDPAGDARFHEARREIEEDERFRRQELPREQSATTTEPPPLPAALAQGAQEERPAPRRAPAPNRPRAVNRLVGIRDPAGWHLRDVLRMIGWSCILVAVFLLLPCQGAGSGRSHKPGSTAVTTISFSRGTGLGGLILAGSGVVVLAASLFVRGPRHPD
jgi:hypothetical protein